MQVSRCSKVHAGCAVRCSKVHAGCAIRCSKVYTSTVFVEHMDPRSSTTHHHPILSYTSTSVGLWWLEYLDTKPLHQYHGPVTWATVLNTVQVLPGDVITLAAHHDDVSISVAATSHTSTTTPQTMEPPASGDGAELPRLSDWHSPNRMWQMGDVLGRWQHYAATLQALQHTGCNQGAGAQPWDVVCVGDSLMLPLSLLSAAGASSTTTKGLIPNSSSSTGTGAGAGVSNLTVLFESEVARRWLEAACHLLGVRTTTSAPAPGSSCAAPAGSQPEVSLVRSGPYVKRMEHAARTAASAMDVGGSSSGEGGEGCSSSPPPLLLVSEPFFSASEQLLPWAHLRFWKLFETAR